jgi:hypothetical protein
MKRVIKTIKKLFCTPAVRCGLIDLPDGNQIECEIETKQFHGCQKSFHLHKQCGMFYKHENKFYSFRSMFGMYTNGDHEVQFKNIDDFRSVLVRLL